MNYEFRHIRYFIAVAEELHFRRAAERLFIAQPALSRAIQQLEDLLGVKLLSRSNRRVTLTEAGKVFLEGCRQTVRSVEQVTNSTQKVAVGDQGHLTIGYTDFAISGILPEIVDQFRKEFPEVTLCIQHGFTKQQLVALEDDTIDFGFITGPIAGKHLSHLTVQSDRFVVVLSENHPLAKLKEVPITELINESFVMGNVNGWKHFRRHFDALCLTAGFEPYVTQEAYNTEGILGFIAANIGITIHLECLRNYYRKGVVIRALKGIDNRVLTEATWVNGRVNPLKQKFINFLTEFVSDSSIDPARFQ